MDSVTLFLIVVFASMVVIAIGVSVWAWPKLRASRQKQTRPSQQGQSHSGS